MKARQKLLVAALALALPLGAFAQTTPSTPPAEQPAATPAEPAAPAPTPAPTPPAKKEAAPEDVVKVTPYGFVMANAYWDTESFANKDYPGQVFPNNTGGSFLLSARYSRFGVRLATKDTALTGADITGVIEFDFKGGHFPTSASCSPITTAPSTATPVTPACTISGANTPSTQWYNGIVRLRLAAATASWKGAWGSASILAGQEYGLLNPLFAESLAWVGDPLFWQAGNLWNRAPQIRLTLNPTIAKTFGLILQGAITNPQDAITGSIASASGSNVAQAYGVDFGAGNRSRLPAFEGRAAVNLKASKDANATVGIGYHTNKRRFENQALTGEYDLTAHAWGLDAEVNIPFLGLKGEYYDSHGLDDTYFGISPSQGRITTAGSQNEFELVDSSGYWGQAVLKPVPAAWITAGYGRANASRADMAHFITSPTATAAASQRYRNDQFEVGLLVNAGKFWRFGVEWINTKSYYMSNVSNRAQQIAVSSQLKF